MSKVKQVLKDLEFEVRFLEAEGQSLIDEGTPMVRQGESMHQQAFDLQIETLRGLGYRFVEHRGGWAEVFKGKKKIAETARSGYDFQLVEAALEHAQSL